MKTPRGSAATITAVILALALSPLTFTDGRSNDHDLQQQEGTARSEPLELLYFGEAEYTLHRLSSGEERSYSVLTDSVLFKQGDQYLLADQATFLDQQEEVRLRGNVFMHSIATVRNYGSSGPMT